MKQSEICGKSCQVSVTVFIGVWHGDDIVYIGV